MSKTSYKLYYFPARARGELARMLFHAAGEDFEDARFNFEEWAKIKPSEYYKELNINV